MLRKFAVYFVVISAMTVVTACGGNSTPSSGSLTGTWKSANPSMTARITGTEIQIDYDTEGMLGSGLYWKGTLPASVSEGSTLTSTGDTKSMEASLLGSQSDSKKFVYKDGKLQFTFSILGTDSTVVLEK